jgi:manganese/zinc/iron transport system permease protein
MIWSDFVLIAIILLITIIVTIAILKELTLLCFDADFASAQGWPTLWLDIILMALVTAVTVIGLQAVGLILVIAFLITPPTAARFWTNRLGWMLFLSATIGAISGWLGVSISALYSNLPAGAIIVIAAAIIFLFSMIFGTCSWRPSALPSTSSTATQSRTPTPPALNLRDPRKHPRW